MDYARPTLIDRLASEYVLGTLRGAARRRFVALLPAHAGLRQAVIRWERRLGVLAAPIPVQEPGAAVWRGIERTLFPAGEDAATVPWWRRLGVWQGAATFATASAIALGVALSVPAPQQPPLVVVLSKEGSAGSFVAGVSADGSSLVLKPVGAMPVQPLRALELWAVPANGAPRSLGLVRTAGATELRPGARLDGAEALAVSVEPVGGSPSGLPTGPIVAAGKLRT
jgi:anti-sigma-K factor RskA